MSIDELRALANARLAPARQRRLTALLRKSKALNMSEKDEAKLNTIIEECDHLALLKAKAMYSLATKTIRCFRNHETIESPNDIGLT